MYRSEDIERDIREYMAKEDTMDRAARIRYLCSLFNHKDELRGLPFKINQKDLNLIISMASHRMYKMKMPIHVSNKRIDTTDSRHVAFIEGILNYLNNHNLLSREVGFDYTTDEYDFEPLED